MSSHSYNQLSRPGVLHWVRYDYCQHFYGSVTKTERDKSAKTKIGFKHGKFYKRLYIRTPGRCPTCFEKKELHPPGEPHPGATQVSHEPTSSTTAVDQSLAVDKTRDAAYQRDQAILTSGKPVVFDSRGRPFSWYKWDEREEFSIRRRESWENDPAYRNRYVPGSWEVKAKELQEEKVHEVHEVQWKHI